MSEHANEYDTEYGPTPPGAKHEHTDIDPAIGYKFALWLAVAMVLSFGIVYGHVQVFRQPGERRQHRGAALPAGRRCDAPGADAEPADAAVPGRLPAAR